MYLPAISQIASDLGSTPARVSMSISSYFIGLGAGQLFYGPMLDRYGRKKPLYAGLLLFIFASIGCLESKTVEALIAFRLLQALGGCVAQVDAIAMVRDFFPVEESSRIISMLILILGVSPLLAPTAGSIVATTLGWHWIFLILAIIVAAIMLVVSRFLPDGHRPDPSISFRPQRIIASFLAIFADAQFRIYALAGAFSFCSLFVYVAGSPIIFMDMFHVSPRSYGAIFALLSVGFIGGNQVNIRLSRRHEDRRLFRIALYCQTLVGIAFLIGVLSGCGLVATIVLLFLYLSCVGITYPNAAALAMAPFSRNAGSAAALLGALQLGIGAAVSSGVGLLNSKDSVPIVGLMCGTTLIGLVIFLFGKSRTVRPRQCAGMLLGIMALALCLATDARAADAISPVPAWIFPLNPPVPGITAPFDQVRPLRVPHSAASFTEAQLNDFFAAPDWHPNSHSAMPAIVARGRAPEVYACGFCHTPGGQGRPENASLAGLPEAYIVQQLADFKSGARHSAWPGPYRPADLMIQVAANVTADEAASAARYFSQQPLKSHVRVVERARVPHSRVVGWVYTAVAGAGDEPLGERLLEFAPDATRHEHRDDEMQYIGYVPPGSLRRGRRLANSGANGLTLACISCHGDKLQGAGVVPRIAGRSPSYLLRQLLAFKTGARAGATGLPMLPVVAKLTLGNMVDVAAYAASVQP